MFEKIRKFLAGKKTYIAAAAAGLTAIGAWASGEASTAATLQTLVTSVLASTIRAGVSKTTTTTEAKEGN